MKQFIFLLGVIFVSINSSAQTELWGMTLYGGQYDGGTIFKTDNFGSNESVEYNFSLNEGYGSDKAKLTQALDGNFYGLTTSNSSYGILFQYNPVTNIYTRKINFNTIVSGQYPCGSLLQASDGKLYGMTSMGGLSNSGTLFQYDPISNILTKKVDFVSCGLSKPSGSLMQASDGKLYGMTNLGGGNNLGALFQYDLVTNVCIKKFDFDGLTNGSKPDGNLIQAANGKLYGLTTFGGSNGYGVLFQYDVSSNIFVKKHDFLGTTNGMYPLGGLCQAADGKLYGMTNSGGINGFGILFQYDPVSNTLNKKNDFSGVLDGSLPNTSLMQASDGFLYGTTSEGGSNNSGTLFQYDINTFSVNKKMDFDGVVFGKSPRCELMQANDGKLYGSTILGGMGNNGVLFQYNTNTSTLIKKIDFGASEGKYPYSSLVKASDGNLYGMTRFGGLYDKGLVFKYDPHTHIYSIKYSFNADSMFGFFPECSFIEASDGKLYGMTQIGGLNSKGTLFQYDPILDTIIKKHDFDGTNGEQPIGTLIQASDGKLYGTTYTANGLTNSGGTLFQFDISTNIFTKKVDFASYGLLGAQPMGALVQASNGKLYGMTEFGGTANQGVLFQYDPSTNIYTKKIDFTGTLNGANPYGSLVLASDGKLYGMTGWGGVSNGGVLFQYDFNTNTLIKKIDFNGTNGFRPSGSLLVNSNGMLYGMTTIGGANNLGVLFEYNIANSTITTKTNFNGTNGSRPNYTNLIEIQKLPSVTSSVSTISNCLGNPLNVSYSATGVYNSGNIFTAQLSDSLGSFSNPINIGSLNSSSTGVINSTIPFGIPPSSYYKIRVISSDPIIYEATNTTNIFLANSTPTIFINGLNNICVGSNANLTATGAYTYSWSNGSTNASISEHISTNTTYSVTGVNACGTSSAIVSVLVDNTCANVWPGDINNDGTADNLDVLELGLHYNQIGTARNNLGIVWQAYNAPNWIGTISNGSNLNHSDCNGDGIINNIDTFAIYNNYALTHVFKPLQIDAVNADLSVVPDQAFVAKNTWGTASIFLGDATTIVNNINGVAYTINYDNALIETDSVYIEYLNSFINTNNQNLHFRKRDFINGNLYTATTHTVNNNINGFGKIAVLHFKIKPSLLSSEILNIGLTNAYKSDISGTITPLTTGAASLTAMYVGINEYLNDKLCLVYPNPTNGILNISFSTIPQNTKIEFYNSIGALVFTETMSNKNNIINVSELSSGIYFMKVLEGNKVVAVKKMVRE